MHDSPREKCEEIRTEHKVGVFGDRRKTGGCPRSLHGTSKTEVVDAECLGRQTVVKLEQGMESKVWWNVGKKKNWMPKRQNEICRCVLQVEILVSQQCVEKKGIYSIQ